MIVKELIAKLQELPEDMEVMLKKQDLGSDWGEEWHGDYPLTRIMEAEVLDEFSWPSSCPKGIMKVILLS